MTRTLEMDTNSTTDMFTGIAMDTDMDTATETDMDKNYQGLGVGEGLTPHWSSGQLPLKKCQNRAGVGFDQLAAE